MAKFQHEPLDLRYHLKKLVHLKQRLSELVSVKHCRQCKAVITDTASNYCYICGTNSLQSGRMPDMLYKSIKLNENGKALMCPHCDNEELTPGEFCMICGNNIINRCADTPDAERDGAIMKSCRTVLPGNARFCPQCGNESSFYQKGWLSDWRSENTKKAIENINVTVDFKEIQKEQRTSG